ncbi:EF-Tu/IF-2/RF-3 family GTPase [Streptomyces sp. 769]|uniref:EF-Tu/IF-2/RF-3 family GTPase n=1 Tax=Streptomyces sp. 769 TaxID=1262452 RepID=UPI00057CA028|nr:EF-Tu/IF-2/RF-3 family GTPase [Streptomyces sp. 769]
MPVEDVFRRHQGRTVLVTGRIERGRVRIGNEVEVVGPSRGPIAVVDGIEDGRVRIDEASAEMNVGVLLRGVAADVVERGQVLATPGSIDTYAAFTADITLLSEEQGSTAVVVGDRLCFYTRTAVLWGTVTVLHGTDVVRPLHGAGVTVALEEPVALEEGQAFAFRHRGRAAGSGIVTQLPR